MASQIKPVDIDSKLLHLVNKFVSSTSIQIEEDANGTPSKSSVDAVVTALRQQYPEYMRKDLFRLKKQVESTMQQILSGTARKRKINEDAEYDREAVQHDCTRQVLLEGGGGGLNASLRQRYRQIQQDRKAVTAVEDTSTISISENPATNDEKDQQNSNTEAASTKVKKRKLKMKKSSSVASYSDAANDAAFLTPVTRPSERYNDLGGMEDVIRQIRQLVEYPLLRPELYRHLGVDPPRGVLLRGPPGTGKTHLANAVAGQLGVPYFRVSAPELVSGMSGESESRIRDLFRTASDMAPSIIFLDELDAIAQKRSDAGSSRGMEKRIVAQLLTCIDMVAPQNNKNNGAVLILAATNRPESMDPALRRAGRFDKEILLGVPDENARIKIVQTMTAGMRLSGDFDYKVLARKTPGYVGADVRSLTKEAAVIAINRIFRDVLKKQGVIPDLPPTDSSSDPLDGQELPPLSEAQMEPLYVTMDDFLAAIPLVQPSSQREGFATVPDVTWDGIGALQSIREELSISVLEPIRNPEKFHALGLTLPAGVLLYGPPGCGKTLLAKAIAHESGANFISIKGPELLDKYVGESERAVRLVFERARSSSPCVVFFDELDSLVPKRGMGGDGGSGVSERVVNQLLTEMDGLESRRSVFVIAATNRPELIDPAMMRPGRLDKLLYVPLPTPEDRVSILKALACNIRLGPDVDLVSIGTSPRAEGYSGADCAALIREAGLAVLKEDMHCPLVELCIQARHFDRAFANVLPSVSKNDQARYDRLRDRMARARTRSVVAEDEPRPPEHGTTLS